MAVAEGGLRGEVREHGRIANTSAALDRLARKLAGDGVRLRFCSEAAPCGSGIQPHLAARGHVCAVVALSLIPKRAGDRVKTDRRDAASLARLHRAGELTAVWVPDAGHEAMHNLVRARLDAEHALRRARASSFPGSCCATAAIAGGRLGPSCIDAGSRVSSSSKRCTTSCSMTTSQAVEAAAARRDRLTAQIEAMLPDWTLAPVVAALQMMRGTRWSMPQH